MSDPTLSIDGVPVPRFLYRTAWKERETRRLTELALRQGFRGIDTANPRRHYDEAAVGRAVSASVESGVLAREDLFLRTKFTFQAGQAHRLPYDSRAPIAVQVEQSFASSLEHLGVEVIQVGFATIPDPDQSKKFVEDPLEMPESGLTRGASCPNHEHGRRITPTGRDSLRPDDRR